MKTESYKTTLNYKGRTVEIIGEVHDEPLNSILWPAGAPNRAADIYSRIQFFSEWPGFAEPQQVIKQRLFEKQFSQNELALECEHFKQHFHLLVEEKLKSEEDADTGK